VTCSQSARLFAILALDYQFAMHRLATFARSGVGAMQIASYDTALTDTQLLLIESLLPSRRPLGRPPTPPRFLLNGILYLVKSGCPWRLLPKTFPPWKTVHHRFRRWCRDGTWLMLNEALRTVVRAEEFRNAEPTVAVLDSQTVRSDSHGGPVGYDAAKRTKGRKGFVLVDMVGLLLGVLIAPADTPERTGARSLLESVLPAVPGLRKLWVDGGYNDPELSRWVQTQATQLKVEVVRKPAGKQGFSILPRRWVVERTLGWVMQHRRLVCAYERTESSAAGWLVLALIRVMLRRIA
jgi:transposase